MNKLSLNTNEVNKKSLINLGVLNNILPMVRKAIISTVIVGSLIGGFTQNSYADNTITLNQEQKEITLKNLNRQVSTAKGIQENCIKLNGIDQCNNNVKYINNLEKQVTLVNNSIVVEGKSDIVINQCLALTTDPLKECIKKPKPKPKSKELELS